MALELLQNFDMKVVYLIQFSVKFYTLVLFPVSRDAYLNAEQAHHLQDADRRNIYYLLHRRIQRMLLLDWHGKQSEILEIPHPSHSTWNLL